MIFDPSQLINTLTRSKTVCTVGGHLEYRESKKINNLPCPSKRQSTLPYCTLGSVPPPPPLNATSETSNSSHRSNRFSRHSLLQSEHSFVANFRTVQNRGNRRRMRNLAERAEGTSEMRLNRPGGKLSLKILLGKSIGFRCTDRDGKGSIDRCRGRMMWTRGGRGDNLEYFRTAHTWSGIIGDRGRWGKTIQITNNR